MSTQDHPDTVVTAPNVKDRRFTKSLKCMLTDAELIDCGELLARKLDYIASIEAELASIKEDYKSKAKIAELEAARLKCLCRDKYEIRPVDCHEIKNFETKKFCVLRVDTGETIEERDLRQDELQLPLPEIEDAPDYSDEHEEEE